MRQKIGAYFFNHTTMPRNTPPNYEKKFADFIRLCHDSKVAGVKAVVVAAPSVIGDNHDEIIESLSRLAGAGLGLQIAEPEPLQKDVTRN